MVLCLEQHAGQLRVDRDRREFGTEIGEPAVGADMARVDRVEFFEQRHAVADRTSFGWIDEGKRLGIAEAE